MVHQITTIRFDIAYLHHVSLVPLPVQPVMHSKFNANIASYRLWKASAVLAFLFRKHPLPGPKKFQGLKLKGQPLLEWRFRWLLGD